MGVIANGRPLNDRLKRPIPVSGRLFVVNFRACYDSVQEKDTLSRSKSRAWKILT